MSNKLRGEIYRGVDEATHGLLYRHETMRIVDAILPIVERERTAAKTDSFERAHRSLSRRVDLAMENARLRTIIRESEATK